MFGEHVIPVEPMAGEMPDLMDISRGETYGVLGEVAQNVVGMTDPRSGMGGGGSIRGSWIALVALVEMILVEAIPPAVAGGGLWRCWKRSLGASVDVRAHRADVRIARVHSFARETVETAGRVGRDWPGHRRLEARQLPRFRRRRQKLHPMSVGRGGILLVQRWTRRHLTRRHPSPWLFLLSS